MTSTAGPGRARVGGSEQWALPLGAVARTADEDRRSRLFDAALSLVAATEESELLRVAVAELGVHLEAEAVVLGRFGLSGRVTETVAVSPLPDPGDAERAVASATTAYEGLCSVPAPAHLRGTEADWPQRPVDQHVPSDSSWLLWPVEVGGAVVARVHVCRPVSDPFGAECLEVLSQLVEVLELRLGQVREEERRRRRLRSLEATANIAEVLAPPTRVEEGLAHVAQAAARMVDATAVAVLQESTTGDPDIVAVAGRDAKAVPDLLARVSPQVLQAAAETDVVFVPDGRDRLVVLVPLNAHLSFSGVLMCVLENGEGLLFDEAEALGTFADQTALALDRAQAVADRQELLLISDRDRIARDLHDVVIQRLFATGLRLQGLGRHVEDERSRSRLEEAVTDLDRTINDIRGTIFDLQQTRGSRARETVRDVVREYIPLLGFTPVVRTSGPVDTLVGQDTLDHVSAVLRECLSNIMRHADAGAALVELEAADHRVVLRVVDDGVGLPEELGRRSGLANLAARAQELGGGSAAYAGTVRGAEGGTVVEWWAPLDDAPDASSEDDPGASPDDGPPEGDADAGGPVDRA